MDLIISTSCLRPRLITPVVARVRAACDRTWVMLGRAVQLSLWGMWLSQRQFRCFRGNTLIMLYCTGPQDDATVVNIHPHEQTEWGELYPPLQTKTGILTVVYERKLEQMYTDTNKHTCTHTPTALCFISCQCFELPFHHCTHRCC